MTKGELISAIAEKTVMQRKEVEKVVNTMLATVEETMAKGEKVQLIGFGTFETRERKAREGRNPKKPGEVIQIEASTAPIFKAGKTLKDAMNK